MMNSYNYFEKLRASGDDLDMEQYAVAFTQAVVEFCCFDRGRVVSYVLNIVKECDFDLERAIDRFKTERERRKRQSDPTHTEAKKYKLVFEGDDE